jgi:RimJ/RimL family protein N-acetyltransferase
MGKPEPHVMRNAYLVGARLYLRPIEDADAPHCYEWISDPEVRRHLAMRAHPNTEERTRAFVKRVDFEHEQVFAIVVRADGAYIGNCGLHAIDYVDRRATLGIVIGRKDCWNKGYGTEATALLCRHAFETLNLHRIELHCDATNERGLRAYAKVGFKPEGRLRDHSFVEGRYVDQIVMGMLRGELVL